MNDFLLPSIKQVDKIAQSIDDKYLEEFMNAYIKRYKQYPVFNREYNERELTVIEQGLKLLLKQELEIGYPISNYVKEIQRLIDKVSGRVIV